MSRRPKRVIDYSLTRTDCSKLARGKKFRVQLQPGDFGIVPKKLDLEGVTTSEIFRMEQRFKSGTTLYLNHCKQRWGRAQCTGMVYKQSDLYVVYTVVEVHAQDAVKKNGIPAGK